MFSRFVTTLTAIFISFQAVSAPSISYVRQIVVNGVEYLFYTDDYFEQLLNTFCADDTRVHPHNKWYCDEKVSNLRSDWHHLHFRIWMLHPSDPDYTRRSLVLVEEAIKLLIRTQDFEQDHAGYKNPDHY